MLTASRLIFSNKGSEEIKDCIPLVEVERVKLQNAGPPPSPPSPHPLRAPRRASLSLSLSLSLTHTRARARSLSHTLSRTTA